MADPAEKSADFVVFLPGHGPIITVPGGPANSRTDASNIPIGVALVVLVAAMIWAVIAAATSEKEP